MKKHKIVYAYSYFYYDPQVYIVVILKMPRGFYCTYILFYFWAKKIFVAKYGMYCFKNNDYILCAKSLYMS